MHEFAIDDAVARDTRGPVRWIFSHLASYWWLPTIMVLGSMINNWAYGSIPLAVGRGFDVVSTPGWLRSDLVVTALLIAGAAAAQGGSGLIRNVAMELIAQRLERDGRAEYYVALLGKSQSFHASQRIGDVMARATNDMRSLNLMFSPGVMLVLDSAIAIVIPYLMVLTLDARLLLVPTLFIIGLVITVWDYNRRLEPVSEQQRTEFGEMNAVLAEAVGGIEVVKGTVREDREIERFGRRARGFRDAFVRQGEIQARYWPMLVFAVAWAGALLHALILWRAGEISLGAAVGFVGLFSAFRFATFISVFSFNLVQVGLASARRILQMITAETTVERVTGSHRAPIEGAVEFDHVTFGFGDEPVLRDLSFRIEPGQTVAVVGQTGSGKSTLARLVNRLFDVGDGHVRVDGRDVREWDLESLRSQISIIEQDLFLFSLPVRDNIAFGRSDASQAEVEEAAKRAQAHEFILSFKDGYATEIGERGVMLSGGQKQRIAIARAFLTNPRILILDDSTSAIDSRTEDEIQTAMREIAADRTTIVITHRLSQIRRADRVLVLRRGQAVAFGSHHELLTSDPDYGRMFAWAAE